MKKLLGIGTVLLATGCILFGVLLATGNFNRKVFDEMNFDWPWLSAEHYNRNSESHTYHNVTNIRIDGDMLQVEFLLSNDGDVHVEAELYYGDTLIESCNANGDLELIVKSGKVQMRKRASVLTVYVPKDTVFEKIEIDNEMSEINIKYIQTKNLDIDTEMASITIKEGIVHRLYVDMSMASFDYEGVILEIAEVSNDMGSIKMVLYNNEEEVGYHIENSMGNVTIGNRHHTGFDGTLSDHEHAPVFLNLKNSMGAIEVIFKR